jgi:ADP-ribose pyrophosphatase
MGRLLVLSMVDETPLPVPLDRRQVIANKYMEIEEVQFKSGNETFWMITKNGPPIVVVVPFLDPDTILLIKQYRYVWGKWSWEVPAGHQDSKETKEQAALRELEEESGYHASSLTLRSSYLMSSISSQPFYSFQASNLTPTKQDLDEGEQISVHPTHVLQIREMLKQGEFIHAPTIIALQDMLLKD